jgi:short-chain fatty acids transporter
MPAMQRLGTFFARATRRTLPDPLVLACLLTLAVGLVALLWPQSQWRDLGGWARTRTVSVAWLRAVWSPGFLTFALQMCLVLLTGFGLARAPLALRLLRGLAGLPRSNRGAVVLIAVVSCVGCWLNWGFGLIFAGVLAGEIRRGLARRGVRCQYALIVAAAYAGMMIWHGGFSGSAPLKVASEGVAITRGAEGAPAELAPLPINRTILHPTNLLLTVMLLLVVPWVLSRMGSRVVAASADDEIPSDEEASVASPARDAPLREHLADRLNHSRALAVAFALIILAGLCAEVGQVRAAHADLSWGHAAARAVNLNTVISFFLALGLLLHGDLRAYMSAVARGGSAIVGIVIQFPLYAGIQGLMLGAGLAAGLSEAFVGGAEWAADAWGVPLGASFPAATFTSAAIVNFFVPSGGGQWIVQGPIMCSAGDALGLPVEQTVMAIAYGDQLTNMIQPFWAIPLMGMTRVNAREFMGYCALLMLVAVPFFLVALWLFG